METILIQGRLELIAEQQKLLLPSCALGALWRSQRVGAITREQHNNV